MLMFGAIAAQTEMASTLWEQPPSVFLVTAGKKVPPEWPDFALWPVGGRKSRLPPILELLAHGELEYPAQSEAAIVEVTLLAEDRRIGV